MNNKSRPRIRRAVRSVGGFVVAVCVLAGCQSYERVPLELETHRAVLDARAIEAEPVSAFVERLHGLGVAAPETFDPSDGLSPAEGEVIALFYNPELRLSRLEAGVALAEYETAGLWEDPVFGFDGAEILSPAAPFESGLMLNLTIPISGRLGVARDRAGSAYEAELRGIVDAEWRIRADVRRAWAAWSSAVLLVELLEEAIEQVERINLITDRLEASGELSRVEGRLFRIELAQMHADLVSGRLQVVKTRNELLGLMGLSPDAPVELEPVFPEVAPPEVADEVGRLIESNTSLAARRAEYREAEESLRLEIRKQYPDITIGSGYGSEDGDDRLLLGFSIPIPILNANRAGIADARARREVARALAEAEFELLVRELADARASRESILEQLHRFESTIIPMLDEQSMEIERVAALGEVDMFLLLETVTRRLDAKSRLLDLRLAELDTSVTIARLLGPESSVDPVPVGPPLNTNSDNPAAGDTSASGGDQ